VGTTVPDGPDKIFVGGLPYHLTEEQVRRRRKRRRGGMVVIMIGWRLEMHNTIRGFPFDSI